MNQSLIFLDDQTHAQLCAFLCEHTGIRCTDDRRGLLDERVRDRAGQLGLEDAERYLEYVWNDSAGPAELAQLVDVLYAPAADFFLHTSQMETFALIVGQLVDARRASGKKSIRIWSAACAAGEEPYSLAMVLSDALGGELGWDIALVATDVSPVRIEQAQRARYTEQTVSRVGSVRTANHFSRDPVDSQYLNISPEIASMVQFQTINWSDGEQVASFHDYDFAFFRGALSHFDSAMKEKVVAALGNSLRPGGYLVLGPDDSPEGICNAFERDECADHSFYRKPVGTVPSTETGSGAAVPEQMAQLEFLVQFINRGTRDISLDIDASLSKSIEVISAVADSLSDLKDDPRMPPALRDKLLAMDQQFMQVLLFLQVGDRIAQKSEALRAGLQELSNCLLGEGESAPDLDVSMASFNENILSNNSANGGDDGHMSQDDIDALFGS